MNINTHQMRAEALKAMKNAYAAYSNFYVGACVLGDDGNYYTGCNVENVSYGLTICAERNAIGTMIASGAKKIKAMVIVANCDKIIAPCGGCRQVIGELADPNTKIYMFNRTGDCKIRTIAELLPDSFDTEFLEMQGDEINTESSTASK
ncbi:MAG: cytidine deaminase [Gammaproteobacteria bacterium]|jgi:cytidine deaminase